MWQCSVTNDYTPLSVHTHLKKKIVIIRRLPWFWLKHLFKSTKALNRV
uniref:Uncharacterized protein n=1 Tax=Anguilla anguilla TaxID=7936 RepID=A0A0E9Q7Y7_ANGAN